MNQDLKYFILVLVTLCIAMVLAVAIISVLQ